MSMTTERYNEIIGKLNDFAQQHGGVPPHEILMEMDSDGIVEDLSGTIKQEEISALIQKTGISASELAEWAWKYDYTLNAARFGSFLYLLDEDDDSPPNEGDNKEATREISFYCDSVTVEVDDADDCGDLAKPLDKTNLIEAIRRNPSNKPESVPDAIHLSGPIKDLGLYTIPVEKDGKSYYQKLWVVPAVNNES